jgi:hypothetical protein
MTRDAYGALGVEDEPELASTGIRALRPIADFASATRSGGSAKPATPGQRSTLHCTIDTRDFCA